MITVRNPVGDSGNKVNYKVDPIVGRLGTTKTLWQNFDAMVTAVDRTHEHLMSYIMAELGAEGNLN